MLEIANRNHLETGVVLIPAPFQFDPRMHDSRHPWALAGTEIEKRWLTTDTGIQRKMRLWATTNGVPFLDLTPIFRKEAQSKVLNYELDGHWNSSGHTVAAHAITSWLQTENVFSFFGNP